jgi:DNA-binding MarR family transcriptional regulator
LRGVVLDLEKREIPTREAIMRFAERIPEIDVSAVEVELHFLQTAFEVRHCIFDVLERRYKLSEGKLRVMIILYQAGKGLAPSELAERACVTRATISAMLRRMVRDGLAHSASDSEDGRGKLIALTEKGRRFMNRVLPEHFSRIARFVDRLTEEERSELVRLLRKMKAD